MGGAILAALVERAAARGMWRSTSSNAQTHATPFYARYGFVAFGEEFVEAGIPHVAMARDL